MCLDIRSTPIDFTRTNTAMTTMPNKRLAVALLLFAALLLLLAPCDGRKKLRQLSGGETKAQVTQLPGVGTVLPPVLPIPTLPGVGGVPGLVPRASYPSGTQH
jgi:hypothetical protein